MKTYPVPVTSYPVPVTYEPPHLNDRVTDAPAKCQGCGARYVNTTTGKIWEKCDLCGGKCVTE